MYFEAFEGHEDSKKAVGWVLRNRLFNDYFPFSYCENIHWKTQFPWTNKGILNKKEWDRSLSVATYMYYKGFFQEEDPTHGSTFFASKEDGWFIHMIKTSQFEKKSEIGGHRYYFWKSKKVAD
jgi:spore germination cell wall hydrolase CwlJ-like protein